MEREQVERVVRGLQAYDFGESALPLFAVDTLINETHNDAEARALIEQELAWILSSSASLAAKQEACRRLWRIGTDESLESLEALLRSDDPRIVAAACYAIGRRPSARADEILRRAHRDAPDGCRAPIEHLIEDRA